MGKKLTFSRELPAKSTRGHTDFIYGIDNRHYVEKLCAKGEKYKKYVFRDNHGYGKVFSLQMGRKPIFSKELPEKSTRGHTDFIFGIEPLACVETLCKI
jgi:hypothetical protein